MTVERRMYERKQKNEKNERLRVSRPKEDKMEWVVGLGGAWHVGNQK